MINQFIIYSLFSFSILFIIGKIGYSFGLLDLPDERKLHSKPTTFVGGIAISISYIFAIILFEFQDNTLDLILSISFLIALVGFLDDKLELNVGGKLSLQLIAISYLVILNNITLDNLGIYNNVKLNLGNFATPFTLISILFLINAFNYFDGMDGTLSFSTISVFIILYFISSDKDLRMFLTILSIPLCFYIFYNFSIFKLPKLFLGDSGSLLIGFITAFLLIYISNKNLIHPIVIAWSVVIFVYEFLSINLIRLKYKKSLFKASRDHLHHILFNRTKSLFLTNLLISLLNILLFVLGYLSFLLINPTTSLVFFVILFFIYFVLRKNFYQF